MRTTLPLHSQSSPAKYRHPEKDIEDWSQHCPSYEALDSPALGDFGNEHAHEWRPRDPPTPIENCPGVHPASGAIVGLPLVTNKPLPVLSTVAGPELLEGVSVGASLYDPLEVVAH